MRSPGERQRGRETVREQSAMVSRRLCAVRWSLDAGRIAVCGVLLGVWLSAAARADVDPAPSPAAPPPAGPSLLDLPLERLAEQRVLVSEPIVVSASRREEKSTKAPAMVIVIDQNDIRVRGYSQLIDVLRDLPGMETINNYFSEFGTQVPVRGIVGNNKIVVLINGMRVNPPGGENFPFRNDISVRFAERVEIVYGAGSTLYGQDAISMVVNIVTRKVGEPGPDEQQVGGGLTPSHGNNAAAVAGGVENRVELGADVGINFERDAWGWYGGYLDGNQDIKLSTYVQYHGSDLMPTDQRFPAYWQAYRDIAATKINGNGKGVEPSRSDYGLNVFARVEGFNSSFQVWHRESQRSSAEGAYFDNLGKPVLAYLPQALWGDSSTVLEAKNTAPLRENLSLESSVTYNRYEIDPDSRYVFPSSPTTWYMDDYKYGLGWKVSFEETLRAEFSERFTMLAGVQVSYSDIIPKATFTGGFDPTQSALAQGGYFHYTDASGNHVIPQVSEVTYWNYAPYAEGQLQVLDQVRVTGGLRVTKDDHFSEVPLTPRAALIYDVTDSFTAKYIYTKAFVEPAPYFAYATYDNGVLLATTNPHVAPETAQAHELNLVYHHEKNSLGFSYYYGTQGNLITVSDRGAPQNIVETPVYLDGLATQPRTLVRTANGGSSQRSGIDFYGKTTAGALSWWFSYSYVDFEELNAGVITGLPGISRHNGRVGVTWEATPQLFITPSLVARSTPLNVNPGVLGSELQDPWEMNLYLLYKWTKFMDLFADLRNVTDHHYALGGFTGDAMPQETFHGMLGVRVVY